MMMDFEWIQSSLFKKNGNLAQYNLCSYRRSIDDERLIEFTLFTFKLLNEKY